MDRILLPFFAIMLFAFALVTIPVDAQVLDVEQGIKNVAMQTGSVVTIKNAHAANIRAGNGRYYNAIGTIDNGTQLTILGQKGRWSQVKTSDGKTGWIANWIIGRDDEGFEGYKGSQGVITAKGGVSFRMGPGTEYPKISTVLPKGKNVEVVSDASETGWYRVRVDGKEGYVPSWFVEPTGTAGGSAGPSSGPVAGAPTKPDAPTADATSEETTPAAGKTTGGGMAQKILAEAKKLVGSRQFQTATLDYGNLACAAYVSKVLKNAGAITGNGSINTVGLANVLKSQGWKKVTEATMQPGDVLFWGPFPGRKHGHVGIIGEKEGGTWSTYQNSSSARVPMKLALKKGRPVVGVYRHPKA